MRHAGRKAGWLRLSRITSTNRQVAVTRFTTSKERAYLLSCAFFLLRFVLWSRDGGWNDRRLAILAANEYLYLDTDIRSAEGPTTTNPNAHQPNGGPRLTKGNRPTPYLGTRFALRSSAKKKKKTGRKEPPELDAPPEDLDGVRARGPRLDRPARGAWTLHRPDTRAPGVFEGVAWG